MKYEIYVGEEKSRFARRTLKQDTALTIANAHHHKCPHCSKKFYCWCWDPKRVIEMCLDCSVEASLPKVVKDQDNWPHSKLFSSVDVSRGGWSRRWVTTRELRRSLRRWILEEYKASPPEVSRDGGSYQCGGCRFFLGLDSDYGICSNPASRYDGRIVFEHVGCEANPWYIANHKTSKV